MDKNTAAWYQSLERQLTANAKAGKLCLRQVFLIQQSSGRVGRGDCGRCRLILSPRSVVTLPCEHRLCQDCLSRSRSDVLSPNPQPRDALSTERAACVHEARRKIFICRECFDLSVVVERRQWFNPEVTEYPIDVGPAKCRTVFSPVPLLALKLQPFRRVVTYYENERYLLGFGFSKANLTPADVRGPFSDERTDPVEPESLNELPNSRWHFVDEWTVDHALGGPSGWRYALNWPGGVVPGVSWHHEKQWSSCVRQRRWRRTAVNFSDTMLSIFARLD